MVAQAPTPTRACLLLGASSQLGDCVLPRLLAANFRVHAVSRQVRAETAQWLPHEKLHWHLLDLNAVHTWPVPVGFVVHLAPLYVLPELLRYAPEPVRVVAISSTSARTKQNSPSAAERQIAQRLCRAEQELLQLCRSKGHSLTILRPTMLYGLGRDATIGRMQSFIQRWHFLPIPTTTTGLRQPVHVEDVAFAVLQALEKSSSNAAIYELGGGERLTVPQLAQRIFLDNGLPVRIVSIPSGILYVIIMLLTRIRPSLDWSPALLKRAALDQIADNQAAVDDFQYAPRPFDGRFCDRHKRT